jgi:hypothetical protein
MNQMARALRTGLIHRSTKRPWKAAILALILAVVAPACDSGAKSELSTEEIVEEGRRCLQPVIDTAGSLAPKQDALSRCFDETMSDERGRRLLLGAGNAALVSWARTVAAATRDQLAHGEGRGLGPEVTAASELAPVRDGLDRIRPLYEALANALRAAITRSEDAAAELSGALSFLDEEAIQPESNRTDLAAAGERYIRGDLSNRVEAAIERRKTTDSEGFKEGATFLIEEEIEHHLQDMLAAVLWAENSIRSKIVAGPVVPGEASGSPPPTTTPEGYAIEPPLEAADGALRIPDQDEQPAHKLFFDWLERGGGAQLHGAVLVVLSDTKLRSDFRNLAERIYAKA